MKTWNRGRARRWKIPSLEKSNLTEVHLEGADLAKANLEGADLSRAHLGRAVLAGAHLEGANLSRAHLERAFLGDAHLEGANLSRAHLERAFLGDAHLEGANLAKANLQSATLVKAHLEGADLSRAHLERTILVEAHLERAHLGDAHLEGANLFRAHLERAHLGDAHLEGAKLDLAHLEEAYLGGAHLEGAILRRAHLEGANLHDADLSNVKATGVRFDRKMQCLGVRAATVHGSLRFRRELEDLAFIAEVELAAVEDGERYKDKRKEWIKAKGNKVLLLPGWMNRDRWPWKKWPRIWKRSADFRRSLLRRAKRFSLAASALLDQDWWAWKWPRIWEWSTDFGRSPMRLAKRFFQAAGAYALLYVLVPTMLRWKDPFPTDVENIGDALKRAVGAFYFSVVTLTTLGFGDITAGTWYGALVIVTEVILGYIILGLLISILARLVARRA